MVGRLAPSDLGRPEVSPALGDLAGLPPALMFCGTRDTLMPGCRLLARRAAEAGWDLTYVEEPGLLHVFPILPFIPEARQAWRQTRGVPASDDLARRRSPPSAPLTAYSLWKLRQDVFVVEQECGYPDLDGLDLLPEHPARGARGRATAWCSAAPGSSTRVTPWRIGRVVLHPTVRGQGWADRLMEAALQVCPDTDVVLDAPGARWPPGTPRFGFEVTGPEFLDDGIPHLPMRAARDQ